MARRSLLFDLLDEEEHRAAVVEDGRLAALTVETGDRRRRQGDVYLGRVTRVERSVGAAFVDVGAERPGFLHAGDVMPLYAERPEDLTAFERRPRGAPGPIEEVLREGQKVLVQVTRDSVGSKGPTLTTYVSLPGRWLVLMPSLERIGVSRKVTDPQARDRAREALASLSPPEGMGIIVRTAGADRSPEELRRDLEALERVFRGFSQRCRREDPPVCLLREGSLLVRTLRDWLATEVSEVVVNTPAALAEAREFLEEADPPWRDRLALHEGRRPLFHERGLEEAVDRIFERRVPLKGGGFLLIEPTEALTAVDVNSGKSTKGEDLEETALRIDLLAAAEIGRQVRLRDIGGLIVVDFIDVREPENVAAVNRAVAEAFREDTARVRTTPLSEFGLVEITRRRTGPSLRQVLHAGCPSCRGRGIVRTPSSAGLRALRGARDLLAGGAREVTVRAHPEVAAWLRGRGGEKGIRIREDPSMPAGRAEVE